MKFIMGLLCLTLLSSPLDAEQSDESKTNDSKNAQAITDILRKQTVAWNAADIPEFMKYYWKSEKLTFSSGGATRRGWQATKDAYTNKYSTPAQMGKLRFSNLEVDLMGPDVALVLGNWNLKRTSDPNIGGNFSLVFRKLEGSWLIIHDHSSALAKE